MVERRKEHTKAKQSRTQKSGGEKNKHAGEKNTFSQRRDGSVFLSETKVATPQKDFSLRPITRPEPSTKGGALVGGSDPLDSEPSEITENESFGVLWLSRPNMIGCLESTL